MSGCWEKFLWVGAGGDMDFGLGLGLWQFHKLASLLLIFFIVWVILVSPQIKHSYLDTASTLMTLLMTFTGENKNVCSFPDRRKINEFHMKDDNPVSQTCYSLWYFRNKIDLFPRRIEEWEIIFSLVFVVSIQLLVWEWHETLQCRDTITLSISNTLYIHTTD